MGRKYNDITGQKFKNLLVIKPSHTTRKDFYWECKCDCGETCYATSSSLLRGRTNYCKQCNTKKSHGTPLRLLFYTYEKNALKRNYAFELNLELFEKLIKSKCYYCGTEPQQQLYKKGMKYNLTYNGIDRRNNSIGYTIENSVSCCKFCNFAKSRFLEVDFINWLERIKNNFK